MERPRFDLSDIARPSVPDDAIEDEPSMVDGWVIMRPLDQYGREFFSGINGRWFRSWARYEKDAVLRTRFPEATTVYDDEEVAKRTLVEMDDTGTAIVAAVLRRLPEEEKLESDRGDRKLDY